MPTVAVALCRSIDKKQAVFIDGTTGVLGGEEFNFPTAQAIHRNLVKVPRYCFNTVKPEPAFAEYLYGEQSAGIVDDDGTVAVQGLERGFKLSYTDELGLVVGEIS